MDYKAFMDTKHLRIQSIYGDKASTAIESADSFCKDFSNLISDSEYLLELVYNTHEIGLFWKYITRKTYHHPVLRALMVLACINADGTHKCKLLVIGKSAKTGRYKIKSCLWFTKAIIILVWSKNFLANGLMIIFVPKANTHNKTARLLDNSKILLLLDNCTAHYNVDTLEKDNVTVVFLSPNWTSLI